jgi:hypothetical protein
MRLRFIPPLAALVLLVGAVGTSAQSTSTADAPKGKDQQPPRQVKVAIDPRSAGATEQLVKGFGKLCPNVSIIRDESEAEYDIVASVCAAGCGWLTHFYITVYDKQGKVAFTTDKVDSERSTKAACQFFNAQK